MWKVKDIKNNDVHKAMLKLFEGRNVLFLENDNGLHNAVGNLEIWLMENKIKYNALYSVGDLSLEYIKGQIDYADIIAFETTWTYEISRKIEEYLTKSKDKKIIVECYISEPSWWRKPKGVVHDMYALASNEEDMDDWEFKKLRLNKALWED
jgi:hypothetical protein